MATIASKIQWTTAAVAVAAAATLVPVAFADPTDSDVGDTAGAAVGSSAGQAPTRSNRKDRERVNDDVVFGQTGGSEVAGGTPSSGSALPGSTPPNSGSASSGSASSGSASSGSASSGSASAGSDRASTDISDSGTAKADVTSPTATATTPRAVGDEVTIIEVPLVGDPDLQAATFGWMQNLNIDACILGLSQRITGRQSVIGPYGTSSLSYNSSGCG